MLDRIKRNAVSDNILIRIFTTYCCFLIWFFTVTIVSYYFLPEGLLRNKNPLQGWDTSPNAAVLTMQIFSYNLLSVFMIIFGNMFSSRRNEKKSFIPIGYIAFFVMISINAITLGTWSFSFTTDTIPSLVDRIINTFNLVHRAGLWEMSGQLLILCATAKISLIITDGKITTTKSWKTIKLSKYEIITLLIGFTLMIIGAIVESVAITNIAS